MIRQAVTSLKYVRYSVTATVNGVPRDPTGDVVQFAFVAQGVNPTSGDLKAASWETVTGPPSQFVARCLVGPGGTVALTKGRYQVWIKITDAPEIPLDPIGLLEIF